MYICDIVKSQGNSFGIYFVFSHLFFIYIFFISLDLKGGYEYFQGDFKPLFKTMLCFLLQILLSIFGSKRDMSCFGNQSDRQLLKQCVAKVSPGK